MILHCGWEKRGGEGGEVNLDLGIVLSLRRYTRSCLRSSELRRPQMGFFGPCKIGSLFLLFFCSSTKKKKISRSDCVGDNSCRRAHAAVRHQPASIPGVQQSVLRASSVREFLLPQDGSGNVSPFLSTFSTFQTNKKLTHVGECLFGANYNQLNLTYFTDYKVNLIISHIHNICYNFVKNTHISRTEV